MEKIRILSVNLSEKQGTVKKPVDCVILNRNGIEGDAHAGNWHRQVSLLGIESLEKMQGTTGRKLHYGEFAENITTQGYPLNKMHPLDRLISGDVALEITQIGKKCHGEKCSIFRETGDCLMPTEGIFSRVINGGKLSARDLLEYRPKIIRAGIITLSDRASKGEYEDRSGPLLRQILEDHYSRSGRPIEIHYRVIPDEQEPLRSLINQFTCDNMDLIFTSGGTGIGPRDITPEGIKPLLDKEIPGIMEMIRVKYGMQFPNALLSRGVAGIISKTQIYTLPGNPKAVKEYTDEILKTLEHTLRMLYEIESH
jgi:molybdenum cofactor synthesis domain-containing protein